jgi:hypothetical protein
LRAFVITVSFRKESRERAISDVVAPESRMR